LFHPVSSCISQGPHAQRDSISDRSVNTGALLIAQIHGYLLGLKYNDRWSLTNFILLAIISTTLIIIYIK
jgi:hypothetical protein